MQLGCHFIIGRVDLNHLLYHYILNSKEDCVFVLMSMTNKLIRLFGYCDSYIVIVVQSAMRMMLYFEETAYISWQLNKVSEM